MIDALLDTAIFVYAVGAEHRYRSPCRDLLTRAVDGRFAAAVSADLLQEFLHQRVRRTGDRDEAVRRTRDIPGTCRVLDVTAADARRGLELFAAHAGLHARDAVFAAVALQRGIDCVVSPDRAFDGVPGIRRVDPLDVDAVAALGA